jgi:hypothetical protein
MTTTSDTPAPPAAPVPSLALVDASDTETTKLSGLTQRALHDALAAVDPNEPGPRGFPVQFVRLRSGEMIVLEMRGQSSATGHGKQGLTSCAASTRPGSPSGSSSSRASRPGARRGSTTYRPRRRSRSDATATPIRSAGAGTSARWSDRKDRFVYPRA